MKRWQFWLGMAVSAVFLLWALQGLDLKQVFTYLQRGNYLWLIPSVAVYFLAVLVRTWRWDYLLRPLKRIPIKRLFPVVVIGYSLPQTGGDGCARLLRAACSRCST